LNKLLLAEPPDLCFNCHAREDFDRENPHPPAAKGLCLSCHNPHASPNPALAHFPINDVCLGCHPEVGKKPHLLVTYSDAGHPLKDRKDPKSRYGELSCASCHNPHSSDYMTLFKFPADSPFDICTNCHEYGK
jgi:predicted CXXCH cytochrome family protein